MDDELLDRQLRRLAERRPTAASGGIEAEVWRRIRAQTTLALARPIYLSAKLFGGSLTLAAGMGLLLAITFRDMSADASIDGLVLDRRLFSIDAPALPSTRLGLHLSR